jgi:hypothetical protein
MTHEYDVMNKILGKQIREKMKKKRMRLTAVGCIEY